MNMRYGEHVISSRKNKAVRTPKAHPSRMIRLPFIPRRFGTFAPRSALNSNALPRAQEITSNWKGTCATGGTTKNFIAGEFVESATSKWHEVHDPV